MLRTLRCQLAALQPAACMQTVGCMEIRSGLPWATTKAPRSCCESAQVRAAAWYWLLLSFWWVLPCWACCGLQLRRQPVQRRQPVGCAALTARPCNAYHHPSLALAIHLSAPPCHGPADHDLHSGLLEEDGPVHHDPLPALPRNFRCGRLGLMCGAAVARDVVCAWLLAGGFSRG